MDFKLNDEQEEFRKLAREFGSRELAPLAEHCDKDPAKARAIYQKIFESGLMNVQLSESLGGLGLSLWDSCLIAEGLAQGCSGIYGAIEYSALAQLPLLFAGSKTQQEKFLAPLSAPSNKEIAFAGVANNLLFSEKPTVKAVKKGSDFSLSGECHRLLNAPLAEWFVFAALDEETEEQSWFIVPKSVDGFSIGEKVFTVGRKAADISSVTLSNVVVPGENKLTITAETSQRVVSTARILTAAGMVGVAQSAFEHAKRYAKERHTFGKPIAQHQGIAFMMADMAKDIEAARELTWQAAILSEKVACASASVTALLFASEMVMRVTTDAVQVYGGYGYSKEYPVEKLMRDAKAYQCMVTSSHMLKAFLGRQLLSV